MNLLDDVGRTEPDSAGDGILDAMHPRQIVHYDPEIVSGTPVFAGTRVPAQALLDFLEGGETIEEFLDDFPVFLAIRQSPFSRSREWGSGLKCEVTEGTPCR